MKSNNNVHEMEAEAERHNKEPMSMNSKQGKGYGRCVMNIVKDDERKDAISVA